jgi:hypothetical protein
LSREPLREVTAAESFTRSPNPDAARLLATAMSDISEEHWCAGWLDQTEFVLWRAVTTGHLKWGIAQIESARIEQLRMLSEQCNGWIVFDEVAGRIYVPLAEWQRLFAETEIRPSDPGV